ncbi:MAG: toxin-antitoxin system YwqK family antitoxin [Mucispirillum sp.]|nr:toxin-antitoxin system YwqK family antitoxin [Mucispirillum sp.]
MFKYVFIFVIFVPNIIFSQTLDLNKCNFIANTQEYFSIINSGKIYKNNKTSGLLCYKSTSSFSSEVIQPNDIILLSIVNGYPNGIEKRYSYHLHRGSIELILPTDSKLDFGAVDKNSRYELNSEITWVNGKRNGVEKTYINGYISSETPWKDGKKNGIEKSYHNGNELWIETPWKNGKREGISKEYYDSGILYREITWKNNMQNGITKMYFDNGMLEVETNYLNDEKHGVEKWYNVDGTLDETIKYNNGVEIIDLY